MRKDSIKKTIVVATLLCIICSILVSGAAVLLRPKQIENKKMDIKKNLLLSAGLLKSKRATKKEILEAFEKVRPIIVNLQTGELIKDIDPESFDSKLAAKDPKQNKRISPEKDLAGIKYREKFSKVFLVEDNGIITHIILPVYGKGLWSTMYGFIALDQSTKVVKGFGFYDHGETPGLGGEVDNPKWKESWIGKIIYDDQYKPAITVIKGMVDINNPNSQHQIDGLSGATITSNGVDRLIKYWLGEDGFGPFLAKYRAQGGVQ